MMNILFLVPRFHPCPGGYENYVYHLAQGLRVVGNEVRIFTTDAIDLEHFWVKGHRSIRAGPDRHAGLVIHRFPICHRRWRRRAGRLLGLLPDWRLKAQFARPSFRVIGLHDALKHAPADVIHVGPLPYNHLMYYGIREARRRGIRVVTTPCTHFGEDSNDEVSRYYTQKFQIDMLNHCDTVFALTESEQERLTRLGVHRQKIVVGGAGINPEEVTGGDAEAFRAKYRINDPIVLHLGMKAYEKGSVCVVEAMKALWQVGSQAWLVMAGPSLRTFDNYLQPQLSQVNRLLNLDVVSEQEKHDVLAAASIVVQPSRVESLGLVCLEAWANGKPVIAADIAVMRELIEPERDGLLVPFDRPSELAAAIQRLLSNNRECQTMGRSGQQKVYKKFAWKAAFQRIHPFFVGNGAKS